MSDSAPVATVSVRCPRCRKEIDVASIVTSREAFCPLCGRGFEAVRFDPPVRVAAAPATIEGLLDAAQPCAFHPRNVAVTGCQRCGSFICALCRIDVDKRTLCPTCYERLSAEGSLESALTTFRDYAGQASLSATIGCVVYIFGIILGPLAIYYAVKGLKQKKQMEESDGIVGLWVAIVMGATETLGGVALVGFLVYGMFKR